MFVDFVAFGLSTAWWLNWFGGLVVWCLGWWLFVVLVSLLDVGLILFGLYCFAVLGVMLVLIEIFGCIV